MVAPWVTGDKNGQSGHTTKPTNAKKPKARPARGWRDSVIFPVRSLPTYTGPYHVGTMEMEIPARDPRIFSHIKRSGRHLLQLKTVLLTIYYPASPMADGRKVSRQLWLGRPRLSVAQGYSHFAKMGNLAIPMFLPTMFTKLPAARNAPLSDKFPPGSKESHDDGDAPPTFPLMIFSHGLGGTNTAYSSLCGEFASYGFIVVALEHRDGSGPRTFINQPNGQEIKLDHEVDYQTNSKLDIKYIKNGVNSRYDVQDYIFPEDNPWDTAPNNEKGVDRELRNAQLDLRLAEIEEAYEVIRLLNNGNGLDLAANNLRRRNLKASSSHGLDGIHWPQWKGRIQMDHVVAAGHSFGAATVTDIMRNPRRFDWISQGIIYDIWGSGTRPASNDESRIQCPVLAINSEAFTYWEPNFDLVSSLMEEATPKPAWLMTVRGTVHVNQSDFSVLYPHVCSTVLKMTANPRRALDLNINASLEFLRMVMPGLPDEIMDAFPKEGLLCMDEEPLSSIPSIQQHRPNEKFLAARLNIPHEFWWRITPGITRKLGRAKVEAQGGHPCEEVWVHKRPSDGCIRDYSFKVRGKEIGCGGHCGGCGKGTCSKVKPQTVPSNRNPDADNIESKADGGSRTDSSRDKSDDSND